MVEEKRGPGRPPNIPKFDPSEPWAICRKGDMKFLVQGKALFSHAEQKGAFNYELKMRPFEPEPKFLMWEKDFDLKEKQDQHNSLKLRAYAISQELTTMEKQLRAEGVIDDTS